MELSFILDYLIISIIASIAINLIFRNYAKQNKLLVDLPDRSRKFHKRPTPLTGGLAILVSLLISSKLYVDLNNLNGYVPEFTYYLMLTSIPLLALFLIDDMRGLKPIHRLLIQIALSLFIIKTTNVYLHNLGDLFGFGDVNLGVLGIPITLFCIVGVMNAFNMIDGVNGLCSGCAIVSMILIGFYSGLVYDSMLILLIGSIIGFLIFNLRFFGEKRGVFLGDSGSNLIGFWVAWISIYASQNTLYNIFPITLIWFAAIPLLDCIGLIFTRAFKHNNILSPGRDHIHHALLDLGFGHKKTTLTLYFTSVALIIGTYFLLELNVNLSIAILAFISYLLLILPYYLLIRKK
jgi:UDP-GlcNAc:undecaprenyl-phosphate GlcNAc-1-phosphate transferase